LGTTNTFRPVFSEPELELLDEPLLEAALDDELLLDPPHAAIPTTAATTASAVPAPAARRERRLGERDPSSTTCMEQRLLS
jgi:hypothetical protein